MTNPIAIFFWVALGLVALAVIFYPRSGLFFRWRQSRQNARREQVEDALKHLLDCQQQQRQATLQSLSGALEQPQRALLPLVSQMEVQGLLRSSGITLSLTSEGERWALQIERAHRLWERYLADEARLPLERVHQEAHRLEHRFTPEELNNLSAYLGHPRQDPHGDPIPDRHGNLPELTEGQPLTELKVGQLGRIVHLEDEPAVVYAQILAEGLALGQAVRVLETSPERWLLSDGVNEYKLAPQVAANIFVEPLPEAAPVPRPPSPVLIPLSSLKIGQAADIFALDSSLQGFTRRRFLDLGLTPGTKINPELGNFFGEPRAYRVRGTLIALRNDQASKIFVRQ